MSNTLEKEGLLAKIRSERDGRSSLLALTPEGRKRFEEAWLKIGQHGKEMLADFSSEGVETMLSLLGRLARVVASKVDK